MISVIKSNVSSSFLGKYHSFSILWIRVGSHKMPKKSTQKKAKNEKKCSTSSDSVAGASPNFPVISKPNGDLRLAVHAKPGAKQNSVTDISAEAVSIQIAAPPVDGEANAELIRFVSKSLNVRKSDVSLERGSKSREKQLLIDSTSGLSVDDVLQALERQKEAG